MPIKLHRLEIRNFRGVKKLDLVFSGKSAALLGPNGSGKSSVVDALDFLLTGRIRRLTGEGAGDLSLTKHGPHIDAEPKDSTVLAKFEIDGKSCTLSRSLGSADSLKCDTALPAAMSAFIQVVTESNVHLLTRRELLQYIFTEPGNRAQQVATLLALTGIDSVRKELQGAAKAAADELNSSSAVLRSKGAAILRSFEPPLASLADVPAAVNSRRKSLGGRPIETIAPGQAIRTDIVAPATAGQHPLQTKRGGEAIDVLAKWIAGEGERLQTEAEKYAQAVGILRADEVKLKSQRANELVERGIGLLQGDECPLCLLPWEQERLREFLQSRLQASAGAKVEFGRLDRLRVDLQQSLGSVTAAARMVAELVGPIDLDGAGQLTSFATALEDAIKTALPRAESEEPAEEGASRKALANALSEQTKSSIARLSAQRTGLPDLIGIQAAWDQLSAAETALREHAAAMSHHGAMQRTSSELSAASEKYVAARDQILASTYDSISDTLKELYRSLHGPDEAGFEAALAPTKAGLRLEVDFYGRGAFPPSALHSEGHQDSMGLCFFLALTERLSGGTMPLIILDDILMSVDIRHRRGVARLLKTRFANSQLIITTHDRVWWRQLRTVGVVGGSNAISFDDWSLDGGPRANDSTASLLRAAEKALGTKDVPESALHLRRAVEEYLPEICDQLVTKVRFRADGAYEAGDFLGAAMSRLGELFGRAKSAAHTWGTKPTGLDEREKERAERFAVFQSENWAVNASIHINSWAAMSPEEVVPVF